MNLLAQGQLLFTERTKQLVEVVRYIGGGGQGEVYECSLDGKLVAVKWYFENSATSEQLDILHQLIHAGSPSRRYLWPQEIILSDQIKNSFGYVMELRERNFFSIYDLMNRVIEPSFEILLLIAYNIADEFSKLHSKGYCYRDISFGNVFFDPVSGEIAICDNDNVVINNRGKVTVRGTPRFMAPEIVLGKANPNISTDEFSLAILLFFLLFTHHPFQGALEAAIHSLDAPAMNYLYGEHPVFIYNPVDESNRPIPGFPEHENAIIFWNIYPNLLKQLFTRVFTDGIRGARLPATYWRSGLSRVQDLLYNCEACGAENFFDPDFVQDFDLGHRKCWKCGQALPHPMLLKIGTYYLVLKKGKPIYPYQLSLFSTGGFGAVEKKIAEVRSHPDHAEVLGLLNLSDNDWEVSCPDKPAKIVQPGQTTLIYEGAKIIFGKVVGEIV